MITWCSLKEASNHLRLSFSWYSLKKIAIILKLQQQALSGWTRLGSLVFSADPTGGAPGSTVVASTRQPLLDSRNGWFVHVDITTLIDLVGWISIRHDISWYQRTSTINSHQLWDKLLDMVFTELRVSRLFKFKRFQECRIRDRQFGKVRARRLRKQRRRALLCQKILNKIHYWGCPWNTKSTKALLVSQDSSQWQVMSQCVGNEAFMDNPISYV